MEYYNLLILLGILLATVFVFAILFMRYFRKKKNWKFTLLRLKRSAGTISEDELNWFQNEWEKRNRPPLHKRIKSWYWRQRQNLHKIIETVKSKVEKKDNIKPIIAVPVETKDYQPPKLITGEERPKPIGNLTEAPE